MRLAARLLFIGALSLGGVAGAAAQNLEQFFNGIGRMGQPRRASIQAEWEKISPGEILCVDNRLRRARRSVNTLIDRGIGPGDNRVAGIVNDCRVDSDASNAAAAKPSFNCNIAGQPDEIAICGNAELAGLDRAVVQGYEHVVSSEGAGVAKGIADPLLRRRHACGPDIDCIKRVQLTAIAAFQARGAPVQVPAAAQVTARDNASYAVNGMRLGNKVDIGSPDYLDYTCAPSQQYAGLTGCHRQTAERSRRRRISEATSFLHAADGTAVYIDQNLDPVAMDDNDAHDEIDRLSATLGKASLLPMQDARGTPSGLIASWGAVSLLPLEPERRAELAAGTNRPGILVDAIGNLQRSAQLGLPIYRLAGGAGYVWSASWNGRGRGTLHIVAIDASKLPGAEVLKPAVTDTPAPNASAANVAAAPNPPSPETPKPVDAAPVPAAAPPAAQKPAESAPAATAPQVPAAAPAPANVRVVGPPIELRPAAATAAAPATTASDSGNGLVIFLLALIVALLGAVAYFYRKSRAVLPASSSIVPTTVVPPGPVITPTPASTPEEVVATDLPSRPDATSVPEPKMDLPALVPAESPDSIAASRPDMAEPKDAAMTSDAGDVEKRDRVDSATIATSPDK